jgi:hypothetical protein
VRGSEEIVVKGRRVWYSIEHYSYRIVRDEQKKLAKEDERGNPTNAKRANVEVSHHQ